MPSWEILCFNIVLPQRESLYPWCCIPGSCKSSFGGSGSWKYPTQGFPCSISIFERYKQRTGFDAAVGEREEVGKPGKVLIAAKMLGSHGTCRICRHKHTALISAGTKFILGPNVSDHRPKIQIIPNSRFQCDKRFYEIVIITEQMK